MNSQPPYPPPAPPPAPAGAGGGFFSSVRRLSIWRTDDRWAAGVAAGLAHRFGVDPVLVRGIFVVATLFGGLGLVVYGLGWMLLPEASDGRIHLEEAVRGRFDIALAGAIAVAVVGLGRPVFWWHGSWWALPWAVAVVAVIAVVLLSSRDTSRPGTAPVGAPPPGGAAPAPDDQTSASDSHPPADPGRPDLPEDPMTTPPPTGTTVPLASDDAGTTAVLPGPATGTPPSATTGEEMPTAASPDNATSPDQGGAPAYAGLGGPVPTQADGGGRGWSGSGWDGTGFGGWDGGAGGTTPPPVPPTPPKPAVPGPGSRLTSLVLAVALLVTAGIVAAHHVGVLDTNVWLVAGGALLTVLGLGVLVSGVQGRTQGGLGGLALVIAILLVPAAAASAVVPGFARLGTNATTVAGDPTWVPTTTERAEEGYTLVAGELVVDLTELDDDAQVPAAVTFGNLHVVVPEDAAITVNARVAAGEVLGRVGDEWTTGGGSRWDGSWDQDRVTNGVGVNVTLEREGERSAPHITIDAEVTFGQIIIEERS